MTSIKGISIGYRVTDFFKRKVTGEIYSVHKHSFYCLIENRNLIVVYDCRYGALPFGISVNTCSSFFNEYGLERGMCINLGQFDLLIPEANLCLCLNDANVWRSHQSIPRVISLTKLSSNINFAVQYGIDKGSKKGLGGLITIWDDLFFSGRKDLPNELNAFCQLSFNPLSKLIFGIEMKDFDLIGKSLTKLIGLGTGLTPSMDDVLIGLISALYLLKNNSPYSLRYISTLGKKIYSLSRGKTTIVSETFLKYACIGERYEIIDNVIVALLIFSKQKLRFEIDKIISVGGTSGTELLFGILIGFRLAFKDIIINKTL